MTARSAPARPVITDLDERRLRDLLVTPIGRLDPPGSRRLSARLDDARIVASGQVPPDVVTMCSRVSCRSVDTGAARELLLVYPWRAAPESGCISVMSELGVDLLGASAGDAVTIAGAPFRIALLYQPESDEAATG